MFVWISAFVLCTLIIVYTGTLLSRYGDVIAEKTGLGRTWMGVLVMASITSLPELVTGISSVTYVGAPDIAAGDVLGSCVFNMLILAIIDLIHRPSPVFLKAHQGNILAAAFGILLLSIVSLTLFFADREITLGWVGLSSFVLVGVYFMAMRIIYSYEKRRKLNEFVKELADEKKYQTMSLRSAVLRYSLNASIIIVTAIFLPEIANRIAELTGLGQTFVGNIFVGISTSLPEVVVCVAAVRMNAVDLAIGNLFGSNVFNIFILALDDFLFTKGPLLSFINPNHLISALSAISMTTVAIIGLAYRSEKKFILAMDSAGITLLYMIYLALHYFLR
ncbi:MAG TPA: hypothetical protein VHO84_08510 [Syntrophorhabdaceae bacterium]|nr:hypothetical protein [Syntrophorhabdaceae bacterium]